MKKYMQIWASLLAILFSNFSNGQNCNNDRAKKEFQLMIDSIEYSFKANEYDAGRLSNTISILEELTQLEAETDGNFLGKFSATEADVIRWKEWFLKNKEKLCWNPESNKIVNVPN